MSHLSCSVISAKQKQGDAVNEILPDVISNAYFYTRTQPAACCAISKTTLRHLVVMTIFKPEQNLSFLRARKCKAKPAWRRQLVLCDPTDQTNKLYTKDVGQYVPTRTKQLHAPLQFGGKYVTMYLLQQSVHHVKIVNLWAMHLLCTAAVTSTK